MPSATKAKKSSEPAPVETFADEIRPLLPIARQAFGSQPPGSPARVASDKVNKLVLAYSETGQPMPALAAALGEEISLSGLRRRVRLARAQKAAGKKEGQLGRTKRPRGSTDEGDVAAAAARIAEARLVGGKVYGDAVREAYDSGLALQPIADALGISYFSLWNSKRTAY